MPLREEIFTGTAYQSEQAPSFDQCARTCENDQRCVGLSYSNKKRTCQRFQAVGGVSTDQDSDSGVKHQTVTVGDVSKDDYTLFYIAGSVLALIAGTAGVLFVRRRRAAAAAEALPVLAILEDLKNGAKFPIRSVIHIGRDRANDVVVDDKTISRRHALIEHVGGGSFCIENRSDVNVTLLNNRPITRSPLYDGDLITLGQRTFRFLNA